MSDDTAAGRPAGLAALRRDVREQGEFPFAVVLGEVVTELPHDLYIPPEALEVFLQAFEGPLDLLLYLIKKQNIDILEINVFEITRQYIQYVEVIQELELDIAGDYLVMAAMLAEIKSRMLLPQPENEDGEEEDPRAELIRRLQEYEQFKAAAESLDALPRDGRDFFPSGLEAVPEGRTVAAPGVDMAELIAAMKRIFQRETLFTEHHIEREALSTRLFMQRLLQRLARNDQLTLQALFDPEQGRAGVVVNFLAMMELSKERLIDIIQAEPCGPVHIRTSVEPDQLLARADSLLTEQWEDSLQ